MKGYLAYHIVNPSQDHHRALLDVGALYMYIVAKYMYTAGTGWLRERRGHKKKASGSIGFRGAGNSGPEAGFDRVKSKIGDWRKNENTL